jgi:hypothetical protein
MCKLYPEWRERDASVLAIGHDFVNTQASIKRMIPKIMGTVELIRDPATLLIRSRFYFYGDAASSQLAQDIAEDMAAHWNEAAVSIRIRKEFFRVEFRIEGICPLALGPDIVWYNQDPSLNFFRIEEFSQSDISFVDGIGSNTGYFKLGNLLNHSTTAAHEYGHTLGLDHPASLDIRGMGQPGIMYPRGTICDSPYQYDPAATPGQPGATLNPYTRKVLSSDIEALRLDRLSISPGRTAILGEFSSLYHEKHLKSPEPLA